MRLYLLLILLCSASVAGAAREFPFTLAMSLEQSSSIPFEDVVDDVKRKMIKHDFQILGTYEPYAGVMLLPVTSVFLQKVAQQSEYGIWSAVIRVSVTKTDDGIEVSFANPRYIAQLYRLASDLDIVQKQLENSLGKLQYFGSKEGLPTDVLRQYRYTEGMEGFTDTMLLAEFQSYKEAKVAVAKGLLKFKDSVTQVYQLALDKKQQTLYGIGINNGLANDADLMKFIDCQSPRATAHLPYEFLIKGNQVLALHPRFRIAMSFPDLKMTGKCSFFKVIRAPQNIRNTLMQIMTSE